MAYPNNFNFPYFHPSPPPPPATPPLHPISPPPPPPHHPSVPPPPPPHHPFAPPPSHVQPPPPPLFPPPAPDHHHHIIIIIFVSFGGLLLLFFMAAAFLCFLDKKKKRNEGKVEIVHFDEHRKVKEAIVDGPDGRKAVVLEIEDDVHVDEEIVEKEEFRKGLQAQSGEGNEHLHTSSAARSPHH